MTFLFFWLGLSLIIGIGAGSLGRAGLGWFFLAVLISPLLAGLLLLAIGRPVITFTGQPADTGPPPVLSDAELVARAKASGSPVAYIPCSTGTAMVDLRGLAPLVVR